MNTRAQMRESNKRAREFLFGERWDFLWFKTHADARKKKGLDNVYTADGKITPCLDPYNLFDGCGYDSAGVFWWFQIKTGNWPNEDQITAFSKGKIGCCIMAINVKPPKGKRRTYEIKVREYEDGEKIEEVH